MENNSVVQWFEKRFRRLSLLWVAVISCLLVGATAYFDYKIKHRGSLYIFYSLPIFIASWYGQRSLGLLIAIISAFAWMGVDFSLMAEFNGSAVLLWNLAMRLTFFSFMALILSRFRTSLEKEIELSRHDYLTGLLNVRGFHERAEQERERAKRYGQPLTIAYIDLDNFKVVNDRLGHKQGDILLKTVAEAIKSTRKTDVQARLGGDEFAILLPESSPETARSMMARLHQKLTEEVEKEPCPVTFSIGVVTFIKPPESVEEMIDKSDRAMYSVKKESKNEVVFEVEESEECQKGD